MTGNVHRLRQSLYFSAPVMGGGVTVLVVLLTAWYKSETAAGDLAVVLAVGNVGKGALALGLHGPLLQMVGQAVANRRRVLQWAIVLASAFAVVPIGLFFFVTPNSYVAGFVVGCCGAAALAIQVDARLGDHLPSFVMATVLQGLTLAAAFVAALLEFNQIRAVLLFTVLATVGLSLWHMRLLIDSSQSTVAFGPTSKVGLQTASHSTMAAFIAYGDRFFVDYFLDRKATGIYNTVYLLSLLGVPIVSAFSNVWVRDLLSASLDALSGQIRKIRSQTLWLSGGVGAIGLIAALVAIHFRGYGSSASVVAFVLVTGTLPYGMYVLSSTACVRQSDGLKRLAQSSVVVGIASLLSSTFLIGVFGMIGAAVNTVLLNIAWWLTAARANRELEVRRILLPFWRSVE